MDRVSLALLLAVAACKTREPPTGDPPPPAVAFDAAAAAKPRFVVGSCQSRVMFGGNPQPGPEATPYANRMHMLFGNASGLQGTPSPIGVPGRDHAGTRPDPRAYRLPVDPAVQLRIGVATVEGGLDPQIVRRFVRRTLPAVRACLDRSSRGQAPLALATTIELTIAPDGNVTSLAAAGVPDLLAPCITSPFRRLRFPSAAAATTVAQSLDIQARPHADTDAAPASAAERVAFRTVHQTLAALSGAMLDCANGQPARIRAFIGVGEAGPPNQVDIMSDDSAIGTCIGQRIEQVRIAATADVFDCTIAIGKHFAAPALTLTIADGNVMQGSAALCPVAELTDDQVAMPSKLAAALANVEPDALIAIEADGDQPARTVAALIELLADAQRTHVAVVARGAKPLSFAPVVPSAISDSPARERGSALYARATIGPNMVELRLPGETLQREYAIDDVPADIGHRLGRSRVDYDSIIVLALVLPDTPLERAVRVLNALGKRAELTAYWTHRTAAH